ncbi:MAG: ATP-dependent helicase HrpB [Desulfobulbaceae bacterium]|nr:ATP-dependent helicase HrpB [Desulfobulbaceae bacterium]
MKFKLPQLPIQDVLHKLREEFANNRSVVLNAEPGSGKTTVVPLALLKEPWLAEKKIVMLEPRRLAARMAAKRMTDITGDTLGGLIGYRIRFDQKISPRTRIEVVTEGVFIRMIQQDPELNGVGMVVFDEFHERTLMADLALAFCLDAQELRDDLKIMIMSATMDTARVAHILGGAPVVCGEGRCFPVTTHYLPRPTTDSLVKRTANAIHRALAEEEGDILVFLPGAGEIKALQSQIRGDAILTLPLYGNLPQKKQDQVFMPADKKRLILSTPIAETSLTIEGVSVVIDSGLVKIPSFSPATGLTTLKTVAISKASADQRAGRAGRLGPGTCYRLWTMAEHYSKADFLPPEIVGADLAPLLLEVLKWGVANPGELTWLDPPRTGQVKKARELLGQLGALDKKGSLTSRGRQIGSLPLHPRLALMLLQGCRLQIGPLACRLAALLQNRDPFRGSDGDRSVDIEDRLDILRLFEQGKTDMVRARGADPSLCRQILQESHQYQRLLGVDGEMHNFQESGSLLALAYPDRIALKKTGAGQHLLSSGRGAILPVGDHLHESDLLVAAHLDGGKHQGRIFLGAALSRKEILENHAHLLIREEKVEWNNARVEAVSVLSLGSLELEREPLQNPDPEKTRRCLIEGIKQAGIDCLGWHKKSRELQARMQCAHIWNSERWPDVSDKALLSNLAWIEPYLDNTASLKQLKNIDLYPVLLSLLSWQDQQELDRLVPTHFTVPSGSKIKLLYQPGESPVLAVRLQEMFGATVTPTVFGGKIPILTHLLSPAGRPIQVTRDLGNFWHTTYHEVKKELKGRYPKHHWPDNPFEAAPTRRTKKQDKKRR